MSTQLFEQAAQAVVKGDSEKAKEIAKEALDNNINPLEMIEKGFNVGIETVGEHFDRGEMFLPELIQCAEAMKSASSILMDSMEQGEKGNAAKIVLGTIQGDVHDIGKGIVASVFSAHGIEVYDLGVDVSIDNFIEKAVEVDADIIGTSSLLTTTMKYNKDLIETLEEKGLRDKFKVMIGGGPVTERFAERIGADAFAENANEGVRKVFELIKK